MLSLWFVQLGLLNITLDADRYVLRINVSSIWIWNYLALLHVLIYHVFSFTLLTATVTCSSSHLLVKFYACSLFLQLMLQLTRTSILEIVPSVSASDANAETFNKLLMPF